MARSVSSTGTGGVMSGTTGIGLCASAISFLSEGDLQGSPSVFLCSFLLNTGLKLLNNLVMPSTKHLTYLMQLFAKRYVLLGIERFDAVCNMKKYFCGIEDLYCFMYIRQLLLFLHKECR